MLDLNLEEVLLLLSKSNFELFVDYARKYSQFHHIYSLKIFMLPTNLQYVLSRVLLDRYLHVLFTDS